MIVSLARNFFNLLLNYSVWLCVGYSYQDLPTDSVRVAVLDPIAMTTVVGMTAALLLLIVVAAVAAALWYRNGRRRSMNGGCFKKGHGVAGNVKCWGKFDVSILFNNKLPFAGS